jgi:NADH-quinone oxidoreductase subunit E
VARLNPQNVELAREIIARYPRTRSALIPLLHVAQEQDGWVTEDAMDHIAELLEHAEETLGIKAGATTEDGLITLQAVECIAACDGAPCLAVNYRYVTDVSHAGFDELVAELRAGGRTDEFPRHGTTTRVRQKTPADKWSGKGRDGLPKIWVL